MRLITTVVAFVCMFSIVTAQVAKAPIKNEGEGPYTQLILRGVTIVNGTGAPPMGPVDIVIEKKGLYKLLMLVIPVLQSTTIVVLN